MVSVTSSAGGFVNIEVKGVAEAIRMIMEKGQKILVGTDSKVFQASNFLQQEIQESIIGNRDEIRSVNTGNFANSISVEKVQDMQYNVYTMVNYAKFLEYGTMRIIPRQHFQNSLARNNQKIIDMIKTDVLT